MVRFFARRLALALGILLTLSALMYCLLDLAMDPLDDLRTSPSPNKAQLIENRIALLDLDQPVGPVPELAVGSSRATSAWRGAAAAGQRPAARRDRDLDPAGLRRHRDRHPAGRDDRRPGRALRQYTAFDYAITFVSFLLYSLPDLLGRGAAQAVPGHRPQRLPQRPQRSTGGWSLVLSLVSGLFWAGALGGRHQRAS